MKFFTRELYLKFNKDTDNCELIQALEDLWDKKIDQYREHVKNLNPNVSPSHNELLLHDALFVKLQFIAPDLSKLYLTKDKELYQLSYFLSDMVELVDLTKGSTWMYDEFNKNEKGFLHNIMFDNCEIEIPFSEMSWKKI